MLNRFFLLYVDWGHFYVCKPYVYFFNKYYNIINIIYFCLFLYGYSFICACIFVLFHMGIIVFPL